jgi:hypothetical protein
MGTLKIIFYLSTRLDWNQSHLRPYIGLFYQSWMVDGDGGGDNCGAIGKMIDSEGKPK